MWVDAREVKFSVSELVTGHSPAPLDHEEVPYGYCHYAPCPLQTTSELTLLVNSKMFLS